MAIKLKKMNFGKTKVTISAGTLRVSIPQALVKAMNIGSNEHYLDWDYVGGRKIEITVVRKTK